MIQKIFYGIKYVAFVIVCSIAFTLTISIFLFAALLSTVIASPYVIYLTICKWLRLDRIVNYNRRN
jgi:hypothetical protein